MTSIASTPERAVVPVEAVRSRSARWWLPPLYPAAYPVAYVVMMWSGTGIEPIWFVRPMVLAVAAVLILAFGLTLLLHDRNRAGLATIAIAVGASLDNTVAAAGVAGIGLLFMVEGLARRGSPWMFGERAIGHQVTRVLSAFGAALMVVVTIQTIGLGTFGWAVEDIELRLNHPAPAAAFASTSPDIYMILLDGYPGDDAAAIAPSFDKEAFPAALAKRGFDVERHARTNYLLTRLVLPAVFGHQHIAEAPDLGPPFGPEIADNRRLRRFTDEGPILPALGAAGYETITIPSAAMDLGPYRVDRVVPQQGSTEFEWALLKHTAFGHAVDAVNPGFAADLARAGVLGVISATRAVAAEPHERPRFVYAHVMAPHEPIVFNADGSPASFAVRSYKLADSNGIIRAPGEVPATFAYAVFAGNQAIELVDDILASADRDTVIIILSDHGTGTAFSANDPFASDLNERTSNFIAVRTPGHPNLLPGGTTPINILPRIVNAYLGTSLPVRSDTTWAWKAGHSILDAVELDTSTFQPKR